MREQDGERARTTDDCLGRASAQYHPVGARVAAGRRTGRDEKGCCH
jgi:hypothetical protein